jgi:aspartate carbamoyltransferase catalytic subunit
MYTIREKKGTIKGLKIALVGDILHSRVARSNIWGMTKMGAEVFVAAPPTMLPANIEEMGAIVCKNVHEALLNADVVMGLRIQLERQKSGLFPSINEYSRYFGINEESFKAAKSDAILMHPGPVNRGVEMSSALIDCDMSVINDQVMNGVAVRMALLYLLTRRTVYQQ